MNVIISGMGAPKVSSIIKIPKKPETKIPSGLPPCQEPCSFKAKNPAEIAKLLQQISAHR